MGTYYVGPDSFKNGPRWGMISAFILANLWAYLLLPLGWIVFPCANLFAFALSACVFCCSGGKMTKDESSPDDPNPSGPWPATLEFDGEPRNDFFKNLLFCCCGVSEGNSDAAKEIDLKFLVTGCGEPDPGCCCGIFSKSDSAPPTGLATYTLAATSKTGRTPSCDPTGCCCPICGAVTWLVWSLLIYIVGTILCGFAGANILLLVFTFAVGVSTGLTKSPDFSNTNISYTTTDGAKLGEGKYAVAYCCFGLKEQSDGTVEEVDPEAPAPAPAAGDVKKPTVPIPKKAYLTAMKKSHGLL